MAKKIRFTSTGIMQQVGHKHNASFPEFAGRHFWITTAVYHVKEPARSEQYFDSENLVSVVGPSCLHCEQAWRPTIGAHCPGDPGDPNAD